MGPHAVVRRYSNGQGFREVAAVRRRGFAGVSEVSAQGLAAESRGNTNGTSGD